MVECCAMFKALLYCRLQHVHQFERVHHCSLWTCKKMVEALSLLQIGICETHWIPVRLFMHATRTATCKTLAAVALLPYLQRLTDGPVRNARFLPWFDVSKCSHNNAFLWRVRKSIWATGMVEAWCFDIKSVVFGVTHALKGVVNNDCKVPDLLRHSVVRMTITVKTIRALAQRSNLR